MSAKIMSEITGNVWKVEIIDGTRVNPGDVIAILESMKMEIPVEASIAGLCLLAVREGDNIQEGDLIATIETG